MNEMYSKNNYLRYYESLRIEQKKVEELEKMLNFAFQHSEMIQTIEEKKWMFSLFYKKVKSVTPLYLSAHNGWKTIDWRERCIGKNQTLTLFKSKVGNISGGYLDRKWESSGGEQPDSSAFVFSLTHQKKLA